MVRSEPSRIIWPFSDHEGVAFAENMRQAAAGAHIDRAVKFENRTGWPAPFRWRRRARSRSCREWPPERGQIFQALGRTAIGADIQARMAGDDLGVAPRVAKRQARLFDGAQAETARWSPPASRPTAPCRRPPPSCSVRQCRTGRSGRDGICGYDARRCRRQCRRPAPSSLGNSSASDDRVLPKASRRESPLEPIKAGLDIEQFLNSRWRCRPGRAGLLRSARGSFLRCHARPGRFPCTARPCP